MALIKDDESPRLCRHPFVLHFDVFVEFEFAFETRVSCDKDLTVSRVLVSVIRTRSIDDDLLPREPLCPFFDFSFELLAS